MVSRTCGTAAGGGAARWHAEAASNATLRSIRLSSRRAYKDATLGKRERVETERAAGPGDHERVPFIEQVELLDTLHRGNGFIANAGLVANRRRDAGRRAKAIGRNLHHAAVRIRHQ